MPLIKRVSQDGLTGLLGRTSFVDEGQRYLARHDGENLSAVFLRMVNLASYSVRHGIAAGEDILKLVAKELTRQLSQKTVGRIESGSFVAIAPISGVEGIVESINRLLPSAGETDALMLKAGYCPFNSALSFEDCFVRAQFALDDIRLGSPVYTRLFDKGLETAFNRQAYVTEHLEEAIERGEIRAYVQPIVRVLTGMICEVEVLARWETQEYGFLRPDEFIPELERHQLIHRMDAEVIRLACKQWSEASKRGINVPLGINLSRLDFELCDIFEVVMHAMATYAVPIDQVHIEITESALATSSDLLADGIERFRSAGFELYLDDFGSGYSSLQVLEGKSFDVVKLDMSLLREVEENERARVIVADAISMVKRLNLQTLCEGVETEEQFLFLKAVGCEKAQGYFFGKPSSHEEIMAHLEETAKYHESPEDKRYYDTLGKVNLMDGTRASVHGVEAAHFQGSQPFALIEIHGQGIRMLSSNVAFSRLIENTSMGSVDALLDRLGADYSDLRNKVLYSASKALVEGGSQQFDFIIEGNFCTVGLSHVDSSNGRDAFLVELISVTKYSKFNDFKLLEESLRFLYTLFKRIDLLDLTENTWRNIYLNAPRYTALRAGLTPQDEIDAFAETFIHPDDRERFLSFYNMDTADERLQHVNTVHLADTFFALSDSGRYEDQLFMIIPVSMGRHRQYLSCMRDLDMQSLARQEVGQSGRIDDEVLLSGILEVTERLVFWKDDQRRFMGANQRFLDYYGFKSVEDLAGNTDEDLGWVRNAHFVGDELRVLRGERVLDVKGYTERQGELRSIRVSKMPLWQEGRVIGLVGFLVDEGPYEQ